MTENEEMIKNIPNEKVGKIQTGDDKLESTADKDSRQQRHTGSPRHSPRGPPARMGRKEGSGREAESWYLPTSTTPEQLGSVKPSGHSQENDSSVSPDRQMPPFSQGFGSHASPEEQRQSC
ncbi:hypothetical protein H920_10794 [Fukomys damarensis]|uniref:Uncharacterized protein n=1 Tax=Fukomys damarensis TaxID=885580 RepID=A0A091D6Q3_FUKDA|nr:hypothetical protein H920_10794 [Fukomys damarensis]